MNDELRNREINERLDKIAEAIGGAGASAETLNAVHACRPGHPFNKTATRPFSNLLWMIRTRRFFLEITGVDLDWLTRMAKQEADEAATWRATEIPNTWGGRSFMVTSPDGAIYQGRAESEEDAIAQAKVKHDKGER